MQTLRYRVCDCAVTALCVVRICRYCGMDCMSVQILRYGVCVYMQILRYGVCEYAGTAI